MFFCQPLCLNCFFYIFYVRCGAYLRICLCYDWLESYEYGPYLPFNCLYFHLWYRLRRLRQALRITDERNAQLSSGKSNNINEDAIGRLEVHGVAYWLNASHAHFTPSICVAFAEFSIALSGQATWENNIAVDLRFSRANDANPLLCQNPNLCQPQPFLLHPSLCRRLAVTQSCPLLRRRTL